MREIEPIDQYGALNDLDADKSLEGLVGGAYRATDLYARYSDAAREAGRIPAHPVALGQYLARRGFRRRTVRGAVTWEVTPFAGQS